MRHEKRSRLLSRCFALACGLVSVSAVPCVAQSMADTARYTVTVDLAWTEARHASDFPSNAHWSRLIAAVHSPRYSLFSDGNTASSGLALLATNGRVSVLEAELAEARRRNRVGEHIVLPGLKKAVGRFSFDMQISERHSRVSFATMLAPSPDWFAGVNGVALKTEEGWHPDVTVPLWVWDAGADSGSNFTAANDETQPRESIRLLVHPAFLRSDGMSPIGIARFQLVP